VRRNAVEVESLAIEGLRVGEFEVYLRCGELRHKGDRIKLQERPFQVLAALIERPGEVVTRQEIQQKLWPTDTFVDFEHSINTAVKKLREALGDDAENPRFIETLPRRGYRLIAPVEIVEANGASPEVGTPSVPPQEGNRQRTHPHKRWPAATIAGALVTLLATVSVALIFPLPWRRTSTPSRNAWVQITNFADSATSPALSPDGHRAAFIRGPDTFITAGQIYVKMLPDGQPVQLAHDDLPKMAPVFSPDGSRIAYTTTDAITGWNTWVVPVLGGEPQMLLQNASALTWADRQHVVFSEFKIGAPMGIATAKENRAGERDVYLPAEIASMAHRSWVSPDGKWILISEMDMVGWRPCRVLPFDGSTTGEAAGPKAARCTYAGWSPDGKTMYFSADAGDGYHIWHQRFPAGVPEQMTFGATEEEGIAVSADGRTLVTSAGIQESTVWLHDSRSDRQVSGEGFASVPGLGFVGTGVRSVFSPDGKRLLYLVRKQGSRAFKSGGLWMTDLPTGRTEAVLPGVSMTEFDIAPDGERLAFAALDGEGNPHAWLAQLDPRIPPKQLTLSVARQPYFGPGGDVYFLLREGAQEFLYSVGPNETAPREIDPEPSAEFSRISPRGDWLLSGADSGAVIARPTKGGSPIRICSSCGAGWGSGSKFLYIRFRKVGEMAGGKTIVIGLPADKELPMLPPSGLKSAEDVKGVNVVAEIDMTGKTVFAPGPDPSVYAYSRMTVQRNLFRIPLK
jgi:DNA-binding winged helix-turn-helix (wHTH) protein/Tol biopolymer transport system component